MSYSQGPYGRREDRYEPGPRSYHRPGARDGVRPRESAPSRKDPRETDRSRWDRRDSTGYDRDKGRKDHLRLDTNPSEAYNIPHSSPIARSPVAITPSSISSPRDKQPPPAFKDVQSQKMYQILYGLCLDQIPNLASYYGEKAKLEQEIKRSRDNFVRLQPKTAEHPSYNECARLLDAAGQKKSELVAQQMEKRQRPLIDGLEQLVQLICEQGKNNGRPSQPPAQDPAISALESKLLQYQTQTDKQLSTQNERLSSQEEQLNAQRKELLAQEEQIKILKEGQETSNQTIRTAQKDSEILKTDINALKLSNDRLTTENSRLSQKIKDIESRQESATDDADRKMRSFKASLENTMKQRSEGRDRSYSTRFDTLELEISGQKQAYDDLKHEVRSLAARKLAVSGAAEQGGLPRETIDRIDSIDLDFLDEIANFWSDYGFPSNYKGMKAEVAAVQTSSTTLASRMEVSENRLRDFKTETLDLIDQKIAAEAKARNLQMEKASSSGKNGKRKDASPSTALPAEAMQATLELKNRLSGIEQTLANLSKSTLNSFEGHEAIFGDMIEEQKAEIKLVKNEFAAFGSIRNEFSQLNAKIEPFSDLEKRLIDLETTSRSNRAADVESSIKALNEGLEDQAKKHEAVALGLRTVHSQISNLQTKEMAALVLEQLKPYDQNILRAVMQHKESTELQISHLWDTISPLIGSSKRTRSPGFPSPIQDPKRQRTDAVNGHRTISQPVGIARNGNTPNRTA